MMSTGISVSVTSGLVRPKIRHEWFQTDAAVNVDIFIKNLQPENVTVDFQADTLSVSVKTSDSSETALNFDLFHDVTPSECSFAVLKTKIEIKLKKKVAGLKWSELEGNGREGLISTMTGSVSSGAPAYPSSSKKKHDWNQVEREINAEKPEGEKQLNEFFQDLFKDASDETKMAMKKSFIESNGTCLSTNWEEVSKKVHL